jgi:hypothetical protein
VDVFKPAGAQARVVRSPSTPAALRQRLVQLDLAALEEARSAGGAVARLELFPRTAATFRRKAVQAAFGGGYVWTSHEAVDGGTATLVNDGGRVTGHVQVGGRTYRIEPVTGTLHRILELDMTRLRSEGEPLTPSEPAGPQQAESAPSASPDTRLDTRAATTQIDLLVAFTDKAAAASTDIRADINLAVSLANQANENSGVNSRFRLRGTVRVRGYDEESVDYTTTLCNLSGLSSCGASSATGRNAFAGVRRRRDVIGADLVALIRFGGASCGQGWLIEAPSVVTSQFGYSQVSLDCIANHSFAHELGHNMGLQHDRYVTSAGDLDGDHNFGFVRVGQAVRDIMAYNNQCADAGTFCERRNLFSDPAKLVKRRPFGVPARKPAAADAARRLNQNRSAIAAYRATAP